MFFILLLLNLILILNSIWSDDGEKHLNPCWNELVTSDFKSVSLGHFSLLICIITAYIIGEGVFNSSTIMV